MPGGFVGVARPAVRSTAAGITAGACDRTIATIAGPRRSGCADRSGSAAAVPQSCERSDAGLAARASRVPRARRGLCQLRLRRGPRRHLLPLAASLQCDADRHVDWRNRAGPGCPRRRQERWRHCGALQSSVRSSPGVRGSGQREGAADRAAGQAGDRLRRSAPGRPRQLAQRRALLRRRAADAQDQAGANRSVRRLRRPDPGGRVRQERQR